MAKKKIYRAGLIPFYISESTIHMLFMIPSSAKYGGSLPQLIKGKIEEDESPLEAAIREAQEESGLFRPNIKGDPHNLGNFLGRTTVFIAEIENSDLFGDPNFETKETRWMTPEEFQDSGRDLHKPVVKAAVRWIKTQQNKRFLETASQSLQEHPIQHDPNHIDERYHLTSYLKFKKWLTESPQLTDPIDFGYGKEEQNREKTKEFLSNPSLVKRIESDGVLFAEIPETHFLAIDTHKELTLYVVQYHVDKGETIPGLTVVEQNEVWKGVDQRVENMPTTMFEQFLKTFKAVMTDAWQTPDGKKFWLSQAHAAIRSSNKFVYYVELTDPLQIQEINQDHDISRKHQDLWTKQPHSSKKHLLITTFPLNLKEDDQSLEHLLVEMPHIQLKTGTIDLQFELHSDMEKEEFIEYIRDILDGKCVRSKDSSHREMCVPPESVQDFATELLRLDMFRFYVLQKYDRYALYVIEKMLKGALSSEPK